MQVVYDRPTLQRYMSEAVTLSTEHPVLIDKYIQGTEIEVDALCDGDNILIPGIMQHVERTGVHSGDSITVYPEYNLPEHIVEDLVTYTEKIAKGLNIKGLVNIQYVYDGEKVLVIEVNPRASRTVPILSKVTNIPMVKVAVKIMLGSKLADMEYGVGLNKEAKLHAVKVPVFSNEKLVNVDTYLGPEMKSTGEVLGVDKELDVALYKGFVASNINICTEGNLFVSLRDVDKEEGIDLVKKYMDLGFKVYSNDETLEHLRNKGIEATEISLNEIIDTIPEGNINIIINTPTKGNNVGTKGFKIRRRAAEYKIPVFTCIDTAASYLKAINVKKLGKTVEYRSMNEYFAK